jgi:hypothetical protein
MARRRQERKEYAQLYQLVRAEEEEGQQLEEALTQLQVR